MPIGANRGDSPRRDVVLPLLALVVVSLWRHFQLGDGAISDPYHQGEYFASLATLSNAPAGFVPLVIHGSLDYLPGWVVAQVFGADRHFLPTVAAYQFLNLLAALVLLFVAAGLTRDRTHRMPVLLAVGIVAPIVVGYRDLVLLLSVALYFLVSGSRGKAGPPALEATLGLSLAAGLSWSFDRGIAGAVSIGAACLIHAVFGRAHRVTFLAMAVGIVAVGSASEVSSWEHWAANVTFLIATSGQWSYGWQPEAIAVTVFLGIATAWAISHLAALFLEARRAESLRADVVMLALSCLFFLRIGTNRADAHHLLMGMWAPLLAGVYWWGVDGKMVGSRMLAVGTGLLAFAVAIVGIWYEIAEFAAVSVLLLLQLLPAGVVAGRSNLGKRFAALAVATPLLAAIPAVGRGITEGGYDWIGSLADPPANSSLLPDGLRWVHRELQRSKTTCIFDLSNNGVLNGVARLPTCSRFAYPVYASQAHESEMIGELGARQPRALVYSTKLWSYAIDGRTMPQRFPELDRYIVQRYPVESCSLGYCVRYLGERKD